MEGQPVTIRLLDPPLHEFLPNKEELILDLERAGLAAASGPPRGSSELERAARSGCGSSRRQTRCSGRAVAGWESSIPEIYEMQVRAIIGAAVAVRRALGQRAASSRS